MKQVLQLWLLIGYKVSITIPTTTSVKDHDKNNRNHHKKKKNRRAILVTARTSVPELPRPGVPGSTIAKPNGTKTERVGHKAGK
jgi:hypothetical protein